MAVRKKVNVLELLDYIEQLPESDAIKQKLTPDKMFVISKCIEELKYYENIIKNLKKDIKKNGEIEVYKNGIQETRRINPSLKCLNDTIKIYSQLLKQISEILRNVEIDILKTW